MTIMNPIGRDDTNRYQGIMPLCGCVCSTGAENGFIGTGKYPDGTMKCYCQCSHGAVNEEANYQSAYKYY